MPDIHMRLGRDMLVIEGAMGTMLQRAGLEPGGSPELLNLVEPDLITQIHRNYHLVGAMCAVSNTFSGTRPKLAEYHLEDQLVEINRAGVRLARAGGAPHILGDIGPTGLVMAPVGKASFDEIYGYFAEQAAALALESPDAFLLETFTDIAELRCAIIACKETAPEIPVIASASFAQNGRMELSGTDGACAAIICEAAGADAVAINCGLGPEQMLPIIKDMLKATSLPVIAQPNAGLPRLDPVSGKTVFPGTPDEMAAFAHECYELGLAAVGSCCGSGPAHTGAIAAEIEGRDCKQVIGRGFDTLVVAGPRAYVEIKPGAFRVVGERINPTGKKKLKESLLEGSMSVVRSFGIEQQEAGADLIDVNVGAAGVDAKTVLPEAVLTLAGMLDRPLVIDTTDASALEAALRIYPGRALINSVSGEEASMQAVLPLAQKYGAALVVLALDDEGIPASAEARLAVASKVAEKAGYFGIKKKDLLVDSLVMAAAADTSAPDTTLDATKLAVEAGFATILGVSNVSHGLPMRPSLNTAFLEAAIARGLNAGIINPSEQVIMEMLATIKQQAPKNDLERAAHELTTQNIFKRLLEQAFDTSLDSSSAQSDPHDEALDPRLELARAISRGDGELAAAYVDALIEQGISVAELIAAELTPAINEIGEKFARGEVFLPQLMVAADAMKQATARAKSYLSSEEAGALNKGTLAFATVKGDIHSIGKDICISLLESQGFEMIDLGVDVSTERMLEVAPQIQGLCLSALMTTTLPAMAASAAAIQAQFPQVPVFVGGAVVTLDWAESIGAHYAKDASETVLVVKKILEKE